MMSLDCKNFENMVVDEHHGIQIGAIEVVVLLLSFEKIISKSVHPLLFLEQVVCPNILKYQLVGVHDFGEITNRSRGKKI